MDPEDMDQQLDGLAGLVTRSAAACTATWSSGAAGAAVGLAAYGLGAGCGADLVLVPASTVGEAVVAHHPGPWSSRTAGSSPHRPGSRPDGHAPALGPAGATRRWCGGSGMIDGVARRVSSPVLVGRDA